MKFLHTISTNMHVQGRRKVLIYEFLTFKIQHDFRFFVWAYPCMSDNIPVSFSGNNSAKTNLVVKEGYRLNSASHHSYSLLANNPSRAKRKLPVILMGDINYPQPEFPDIPPRTGPQ